MCRRLIVQGSFEEQDVRLGLVDFVMLPSETLSLYVISLLLAIIRIIADAGSYLCDAKRSPLIFPEKLQCAPGSIKVFPE